MLVDLDSHPPDFLAAATAAIGAGAGVDRVEDAVLRPAEAGAELDAVLELELISRAESAQPGSTVPS